MIIATDYELRPDPSGFFTIQNKNAPICPDCGVLCSGYDTKRRQLIDGTGEARIFHLRRLRCPQCHRLHVEIPDIMEPRKHYDRATIESARAGNTDGCAAEDSTIRRWRK